MLNRVKARMVKEQPVLSAFIAEQASIYESEEMFHIFQVAVGVYALLEQQAAINKISSSFTVTPEEK